MDPRAPRGRRSPAGALAGARIGVDAPAQLAGVGRAVGQAKAERLALPQRGEPLDPEDRPRERRQDRLVGDERDRVLALEGREPGQGPRDPPLGHERLADDEAPSVLDAGGDDLGGLDGADERAAGDEREVPAAPPQPAAHARDRRAPSQGQRTELVAGRVISGLAVTDQREAHARSSLPSQLSAVVGTSGRTFDSSTGASCP